MLKQRRSLVPLAATVTAAGSLLVLLLLLSACGQKGPLTLAQPAPTSPAPAASSPHPASQ
ncbi:LPS translocon maturation chaperone LptM [Piscinibacter sp.]|uniref:LPS translocon maturation chaperone LptM n=1 Tax=Piscinibacter sp. TaxID=1903157 RepID=UPI00391EF6D6